MNISTLHKNIANGILFQIGWFGCILGGTYIAILLTAIILIIHYFIISNKHDEWIFIIFFAIVGITIDSILTKLGLFKFRSGLLPIPIWLVTLWILFGTTFFHAINWLNNYFLAALLGAFGGSTSYYAGMKLSHTEFGIDTIHAMIVLAIVWALLVPITIRSKKYFCLHKLV